MGRHVPIKIQREIEWRFGRHCGFPGCKKPARDLHHTKRFALVQRHAEEEIVPLCKIHHELAHEGAIENEELLPNSSRDEGWRLCLGNRRGGAVEEIDKIVQRKKWKLKN